MQNIAIVGLGFMGAMHAQVYSQLKDAQVVAIIDLGKAKAQKALRKLGIDVPVFPSVSAAVAAVEIDVVDICLPTDVHAVIALEAIALGKQVFCEKPLALNTSDARKIVTAAKKAGVFLQVGQCIRFWPEYQAFEAFVKSGKAGKLLSLSMQRRAARPGYSDGDWLNNGERSGGAALDLHIHDTDFVHHLLGQPQAVTSRGTVDATGWSHIFTTYHFPDVVVTAEGGWNYPKNWGFQMAFQAVFENGAVEFDSGASPTLTVTLGTAKKKALPFKATGAGESTADIGNVSSLGGYFNELQAFVRCLETGHAPEIATGEQAAGSLATVLAEIRSASTGRTVLLGK